MNSQTIPSFRRRQLLKWMAMSPLLPILHTSRGANLSPNESELLDLIETPDWDLLLNSEEIKCLSALCDLILPGDDHSPAASQLGLTDFVNEWISAPFPSQMQDRITIRGGLVWLDGECQGRHGRSFVELKVAEQLKICDDIQQPDGNRPEFLLGARFFARLRELTCSGFFTTPEGRRDLNYLGNVPLSQFSGPPAEVLEVLETKLKALGL